MQEQYLERVIQEVGELDAFSNGLRANFEFGRRAGARGNSLEIRPQPGGIPELFVVHLDVVLPNGNVELYPGIGAPFVFGALIGFIQEQNK